MEKRLLMAIGLSFLVLLIYSSAMPKTQPVANKCVISQTREQKPIERTASLPPSSLEEILLSPDLSEKDNLVVLETEESLFTFSKRGGFLSQVFDKKHNSAISFKGTSLVKEWANIPFVASGSAEAVVFEYKGEDGVQIRKEYRLSDKGSIELTISISNATDSSATSYNIIAGYFRPSAANNQVDQRYFESAIRANDIVSRKLLHGLKKQVIYDSKITWVSIRDRYFCAVILPQIVVNKALINPEGSGYTLDIALPARSEIQQAGSMIVDKYKLYVGPQDENNLKSFGEKAESIINFGKFDPISKMLLSLLNIIYRVTKNWGISIILISIAVYVLLYPLSFKSMLSMKRMQAIQPQIEELRSKHKENPQKLNTEIMELYRKEKINPLGGCLPLILQIPVFFALYQLLSRLISLKCSSFLWIKDLSEPDRLFVFSSNLPVVGREFNILPIFMAATMFLQQKVSSQASSGTSAMAEQQKIMAVMMPVIFGILFYKMSSGLVLYWFTNSLLMFAFQWKIAKSKITP